RPIINPDAHYDQTGETVAVAPGPGGAHNWSPMSYNPSTGLIYIPASTTGNFTYTEDKNFTYAPGRQNMGINFGPPRGGPAGAAGARGAGPGAPAPAAAPPPPA